MARPLFLFTRTLDLILLVRDTDDAFVALGLTDRNTRLRRIYVCVHTPLKHTNGTDRPVPSVNHAELSIVFVQAHNVSVLLGLSPKLPTLKIIVAIGEISPASRELLDTWSKQREIRVVTLGERRCLSELICGRDSPYESSGRHRRQVSH